VAVGQAVSRCRFAAASFPQHCWSPLPVGPIGRQGSRHQRPIGAQGHGSTGSTMVLVVLGVGRHSLSRARISTNTSLGTTAARPIGGPGRSPAGKRRGRSGRSVTARATLPRRSGASCIDVARPGDLGASGPSDWRHGLSLSQRRHRKVTFVTTFGQQGKVWQVPESTTCVQVVCAADLPRCTLMPAGAT